MAPPLTRDSAILPCFHGCLAFLHSHFPPQFPPSHSIDPSVCSQQHLSPWDCSTRPKLQIPAAAPSRRPASLSGVCLYGRGKDCLILIPFRLPQISCFTLSLKCFSSDSDNCPASVPPPAEGWSSPTNILGFPPSSFCVVLYILFHWSGTPVSSQLVSCMHFCV